MLLIISLFLILPCFLFLYWFNQKPTSLLTGGFFLYLLGGIFLVTVLLLEKFSQSLALLLALPVILVLLVCGLFGIYGIIIALFWNEGVLLKHERPSFSNFLPLIIATALIFFEISLFFVTTKLSNTVILSLFGFLNLAVFYFGFIFILYSLTCLLFNLFPLNQPVDYIIVLGAGLNKDKVTPLLASRIQAAITLYHKQEERFNHQPRLILSGGQGADEEISEALAMANYIHEEGYQLNTLYLEDKSTNTRENLIFSEKIAREQDGISSFKNKRVVLATNNYHLLRAGKLAAEQGIKVRGVGSKTRLYYLPTAFIREYVGYLVMTKKKHLWVIISLFILSLIPLLLTLLT